MQDRTISGTAIPKITNEFHAVGEVGWDCKIVKLMIENWDYHGWRSLWTNRTLSRSLNHRFISGVVIKHNITSANLTLNLYNRSLNFFRRLTTVLQNEYTSYVNYYTLRYLSYLSTYHHIALTRTLIAKSRVNGTEIECLCITIYKIVRSIASKQRYFDQGHVEHSGKLVIPYKCSCSRASV